MRPLRRRTRSWRLSERASCAHASIASCRWSRRRRRCAPSRSAAFRGAWCSRSDDGRARWRTTRGGKPIEDVSEISAITYGFMASKALFAALEFDLFTHIAQGAASTSALAAVTGIAENRLVTLLAALKSLGVVSDAGGRLINAPATARYLVAGAPGDFRDYVRFVNGEFGYESFRHLGPALRGERIFPDKGFYEGMIYDSGIGG